MQVPSHILTQSTSSKKEVWAQWDEVWEHRIASEARLLRLISVTTPDFVYQSPQHDIRSNLDTVVAAIDELLHEEWDNYRVVHVQWYEHHDQSAVQWKVVTKSSGAVVSQGWSHARYSMEGKLASVVEFYDLHKASQAGSGHKKMTRASRRLF